VGTHKQVEKKIIDEINEVIGNNPVTESDIQHFPYISSVIKETLRIQPVIIDLARYTTTSVQLGDYFIPKGSTVSPYLWAAQHTGPDCDEFNPDRFLHQDEQSLNFLAFSVAPRSCIGTRFAMQELILFIVELYRNFKIELVEADQVICCLNPTAQPINLKAKFIPIM